MLGYSDSTLLPRVHGQIRTAYKIRHAHTDATLQDNPLDVSLVPSFYCISPQIFKIRIKFDLIILLTGTDGNFVVTFYDLLFCNNRQ